MFDLTKTNRFKKDVNRYQHSPQVIGRLQEVISYLVTWNILPEHYKDHPLHGKYKWHRECHMLPNVLLIYAIDRSEKLLVLSFLWSHSDLFR